MSSPTHIFDLALAFSLHARRTGRRAPCVVRYRRSRNSCPCTLVLTTRPRDPASVRERLESSLGYAARPPLPTGRPCRPSGHGTNRPTPSRAVKSHQPHSPSQKARRRGASPVCGTPQGRCIPSRPANHNLQLTTKPAEPVGRRQPAHFSGDRETTRFASTRHKYVLRRQQSYPTRTGRSFGTARSRHAPRMRVVRPVRLLGEP
ncbi:hypothetical protein K466DRAFT_373215 [Polyporus arcularius HHB13444]|uniref:Uncharacterized protein n=1 Tax=Polyporus arcularius HHB13444 TaxID=1314778 RepID=A0A5C3NVL7_9APHY|nr:hypothetical protein K466DRAFT_373215 [Polyporus arcularius HHB13444]